MEGLYTSVSTMLMLLFNALGRLGDRVAIVRVVPTATTGTVPFGDDENGGDRVNVLLGRSYYAVIVELVLPSIPSVGQSRRVKDTNLRGYA